ncbi:MAG: diacylglycerol kinase family protein [Patescibacteria group bacterium]
MNNKRFIKSFRDALRGITYMFRHEQNFRIQLFIAILVIVSIFVFDLRKSEIIVVLLLILSVLILEMLNSALEKFTDIIKPRLHYQVEIVKDVMAAMVFFASIGAVIIGMIIFWPHVFELLGKRF